MSNIRNKVLMLTLESPDAYWQWEEVFLPQGMLPFLHLSKNIDSDHLSYIDLTSYFSQADLSPEKLY